MAVVSMSKQEFCRLEVLLRCNPDGCASVMPVR
jgi:hypothetical protein